MGCIFRTFSHIHGRIDMESICPASYDRHFSTEFKPKLIRENFFSALHQNNRRHIFLLVITIYMQAQFY